MSDSDGFDPITSDDWHRVAGLRPRWSAGTQASRRWSRGQRWYILTGPDEGAHCRLNGMAYDIVARMDGQTTMSSLWSLLARQASADTDAPSQDELLRLLLQLMRLGLIDFDTRPDLHVGGQHLAVDTAPLSPRRFGTWRLSFGDPSPWLDPNGRWSRLVFSGWGAVTAFAILTWLGFQSLVHVDALTEHTRQWFQQPGHVLATLLTVPLLKLVHELAHGLAVRRWNGHVHRWGIALVYGLPMPFVDASASHGFSRGRRIIVSAAGILADLHLAAAGLLLWSASPPGLGAHVGHALWLAGCVSSLLVNANPLQRQDGYHLLTDALDLPNLATRSTTWWHTRCAEWVRGRDSGSPVQLDAPDAHEVRAWLIAYAPLAWMWQFVIWATLTAWMASIHPALGASVGLLAGWATLLHPGWRLLQHLWRTALLTPGPDRLQARALRRFAALCLGLIALPWAPVPDLHTADGILSPPDAAWIRAAESGFLQDILVEHGEPVTKGQAVARLHNPKLALEQARLGSELQQAQQAHYAHLATDPTRAGQAEEDITRIESALAQVAQRIDDLTLKAQQDGHLAWPDAADQRGRYVKRGESLAHVAQGDAPRVLLAIDVVEAHTWQDLQRGTLTVHAGPGPGAGPWRAARVWQSAGATQTLPTPMLSSAQGGPVDTRPADAEHRRTVSPVVLIELELITDARGFRQGPGHRVEVQLDRGWTPALWRIWHALQTPWRKLLEPSA